ncbi:hypothetical protein AORI_3146 [Amycolatopsis keratiniphila]|uniref:Uncharacterized protein n=1 Tax=Amycolatopsis keratiniphila TaxID=129921 RepID=R4SZX9_9PSEU|nr:hypothetical protein AORI_3146 [Amycolatopsis keratiniphila]
MVAAYSPTRSGRNVVPVIQSMPWPGPATKPSSDIVKCQSTFPSAVWGSSITASCRFIPRGIRLVTTHLVDCSSRIKGSGQPAPGM